MKDLGLYLKQARQKKNLTIEDVSANTKIHPLKLQAIEEGDLRHLPAKVFIIGLVKSYARFLKADMTEVEKLCRDAFSTDDTKKSVEEPEVVESDEATKTTGWFKTSNLVMVSVGLVVVVLLIAGILWTVSKLNSYSSEKADTTAMIPKMDAELETKSPIDTDNQKNEGPETLKTPSTDKGLPKSNERNEIKVAAQKAKEAKEAKEAKDAKEAKEASSSAPIEASTKLVENNKNQDSKINKSLETSKPAEIIGETTDSSSNSDETPEQTQPTTAKSNNKLVISAIEPTTIEIIWSDDTIQEMKLESLDSKTLVFSSPITVKTDRGGVVNFKLNDQQIDRPGTAEQPLSIQFP